MKTFLHLSLLTLAILWGHAAAAGDSAYFAAYDQVNSADVEIAELGAVKGHSPEVRKLAVMVLRDHSGVRQAARDIAQDHGISYTVPTDNEFATTHAATLERLSGLNGEAFDKAYLKHEAAFHADAMNAVRQTLIPSVQTPEFRDHLTTVLPHFEHHLSSTLATADALGYDTH